MTVFRTPKITDAERAALERIEELRRDVRFRTSTPRRWVGGLRRELSARASAASTAIEGFTVSVEDALAVVEGAEPSEAAGEDRSAILGYGRAMDYVLALADDPHYRLNAELIRSLHFLVVDGSLAAGAGRWREGPIYITGGGDQDIAYEGPPAAVVPALVDEAITAIDGDDSPPMIRAAMAHLNLVEIHPFRDGNGRTSRVLQALVLAREGVVHPAWVSIEEQLGADTAAYYGALQAVGGNTWQPDRDARSWIRFCLEAHYRQASSVLRRVEEAEREWVGVEELRAAAGLAERSTGSLLDAARGLRITNASYRREVQAAGEEAISEKVATSDLTRATAADLLERHGAKRGTFYTAGLAILELRDRLGAERRPIDAANLFAVGGKAR
jgi:Fic family protein